MDSLYKVIRWLKCHFNGAGDMPLINRASYVCLSDELVSSDAAEFLRLYRNGDIESLIRAEKCVTGPIMYDCDCEWLEASIGYYETCYADILETLISHFNNTNDNGRARIYRMKSDCFFDG